MSSKNIDRLFQEKLKDFEAIPNPAVWNKIETSLQHKKKQRKAFIWYRLGGVAAALLLGFFVFTNTATEPTIEIEETITDIEKNNSKPIEIKTTTPKTDFQPNSTINNSTIVSTEKTILKTEKKQQPTPNTKTQKKNRSKLNPQQIAGLNAIEVDKIAASPQNIGKKKHLTHFDTSIGELNDSIIKGKTIFEGLVYNDSLQQESYAKTVPDTVLKKQLFQQKNLEEIVALEEIDKEKIEHQWIVSSNISQLYSNTLSNKSSLDPLLNDAKKEGSTSNSFGLKIAYQASKKWTFQTGIHSVELGQTTKEIALNRNSSFQPFANTEISSFKNTTSNFSNDNNGLNDEVKNTSPENITQTYGYLEIPMEVKYALLEKNKFRLQLIGGFSTLVLTKNEIQIEKSNLLYSGGEATNLNSLNFSVNFGTDFEYHFSKNWFFDISPMIKMQTSTYNTSGNKPYFFGIYTGINYKF